MQLNPKTHDAYNLMHQGILALARAEQQGIRVDMEYVQRKKEFLTRKIEYLEKKFKETDFFKHWQHTSKGPVNIDSDAQLRHFLYHIKKIKPPKLTTTGQGATDSEALQQLNIPELNILAERAKIKRLRDVNLEGFAREQVRGYIHPFFNLHLARTFRSSSDHPNFQNVPIRDEYSMQIVRKALFPRPGHQLLEIDYSGIEVRIAACYHKDPTMIKYITDPKSDMHADMAKQLFLVSEFDKSIPEHATLRQAAKNGFVFPEFYGDYYKNCAINLACNWGKLPQGIWKPDQGISMPDGTLSDHLISKGIKNIDSYTEHVKKIETDFWSKRFPEYAAWKDRWFFVYKKNGYIDTLTGFRCSGVMGRNDTINYPVQGSAFHCNLWALIELDRIMREAKWNTRIIGQIHDSIIMDVDPSELSYVTEIAYKITTEALPRNWKWIIVPLDVEMSLAPVDGSWADKEKYKFN